MDYHVIGTADAQGNRCTKSDISDCYSYQAVFGSCKTLFGDTLYGKDGALHPTKLGICRWARGVHYFNIIAVLAVFYLLPMSWLAHKHFDKMCVIAVVIGLAIFVNTVHGMVLVMDKDKVMKIVGTLVGSKIKMQEGIPLVILAFQLIFSLLPLVVAALVSYDKDKGFSWSKFKEAAGTTTTNVPPAYNAVPAKEARIVYAMH